MSKTRLVGLLSPEEAACIAEAGIIDTLETALAVSRNVVTLALEGSWLPPARFSSSDRFRISLQRGANLAERIENAFFDARLSYAMPTILIVSDCPQMKTGHIESLFVELENGADAVLGPSPDGGFWALGMASVVPELTRGVPMSTDRTRMAQLERLRQAGMKVSCGEMLRDCDTFEDAAIIRAFCAPDSAFAAAWDEALRLADSRVGRFVVVPSPA